MYFLSTFFLYIHLNSFYLLSFIFFLQLSILNTKQKTSRHKLVFFSYHYQGILFFLNFIYLPLDKLNRFIKITITVICLLINFIFVNYFSIISLVFCTFFKKLIVQSGIHYHSFLFLVFLI